MGLLTALFKRKAAQEVHDAHVVASPPTGALRKLSMGHEPTPRPLPTLEIPNNSTTNIHRPNHALDETVDISITSMDSVDYTHDEELSERDGDATDTAAPPVPLLPQEEDHHEGSEGSAAAEDELGGAHDDPVGAGLLASIEVYLTEDGENAADAFDTISVVSDQRGDGELTEELTELGRALECLESEGPSSPLARAASNGAAAFAAAAAAAVAAHPPLGSSPGGSYSTSSVPAPEQFAKNMVKLYNDLALRLMDARDYSQALSMLLKAEALLDNDAAWMPGYTTDRDDSNHLGVLTRQETSGSLNLSAVENSLEELGSSAAPGTAWVRIVVAKRARLRAITYNNIGCLYKRQALPEEALPYLQNALALEEAAGNVHDCASTHLNLCAAYSALGRFKDALNHAERAIILLQRQLWGGASFQEGVAFLGRCLAGLAATGAAGEGGEPAAGMVAHRRQRKLLASANILAMAYHNAAVEHERLGRLREAQVSYSRACTVGTRFLGPKSSTTTALVHAQKGFAARQHRDAAGSGGHHHHAAGHGAVSGAASRKGGAALSGRSASSSLLASSKGRQGSASTRKLGGVSRAGSASSSRLKSTKTTRDRR